MSRVCVIGASMLDVVGKSFDKIILEDSNPGKLSIKAGGVGHNIASNLAKLGTEVSLITTLSQDALSSVIRNSLPDVNLEHVFTSDLPTATYLAILDDVGDLVVSLSDTTALDTLPPEFLRSKREVIDEFEIIVVDATLHEAHFEVLIEQHQNKKVYLEPVSVGKAKYAKPYLDKFYSVKCNALEASFLSDIKIENKDDYFRAADKLLNLGVKKIIITRGEDGGFYGDENTQFFYESVSANKVNATGAGDAFMAGFIFAELHEYDPVQTIEFARHMAAMAVETVDTVNPNITKDKVEERINETRKFNSL